MRTVVPKDRDVVVVAAGPPHLAGAGQDVAGHGQAVDVGGDADGGFQGAGLLPHQARRADDARGQLGPAGGDGAGLEVEGEGAAPL